MGAGSWRPELATCGMNLRAVDWTEVWSDRPWAGGRGRRVGVVTERDGREGVGG